MNKVHVPLLNNILAIVTVKACQPIIGHFFETFRATNVGYLIQWSDKFSNVTLKTIDSLRSTALLGSHRFPSRDSGSIKLARKLIEQIFNETMILFFKTLHGFFLLALLGCLYHPSGRLFNYRLWKLLLGYWLQIQLSLPEQVSFRSFNINETLDVVLDRVQRRIHEHLAVFLPTIQAFAIEVAHTGSV